MQEDDLLIFETWGGGGWGDPLMRDATLVARDVRRGLATREGARAYGVVLDAALKVDEAASNALRAQLAAARPPAQVFARGGTIEELKARCLADTGLPPPEAPGTGAEALRRLARRA